MSYSNVFFEISGGVIELLILLMSFSNGSFILVDCSANLVRVSSTLGLNSACLERASARAKKAKVNSAFFAIALSKSSIALA